MLEAIDDGLADTGRVHRARCTTRPGGSATLVDDLFELARIDAGALALELRSVALAPIVESCLRGFEAEARARNVSSNGRGDASDPEALCAPEQVERVLLNLLTNALRHTPSDGTVAVVLAPTPTTSESLSRTTARASTSHRRRMFDRFWRGDPPATAPAPASASRSPAGSSKPRAAPSGPKREPAAAPESPSPSRANRTLRNTVVDVVDGLEDPATDASELTALRRFTSANNGRLAFTSRRTKPSSKLTKYRWPRGSCSRYRSRSGRQDSRVVRPKGRPLR